MLICGVVYGFLLAINFMCLILWSSPTLFSDVINHLGYIENPMLSQQRESVNVIKKDTAWSRDDYETEVLDAFNDTINVSKGINARKD